MNLPARKRIYRTIKKFPGLHFRALQRKLDIGTGHLQYHLSYLTNIKLIQEEKDNKLSRFYPIETSEFDRTTLNALRKKQCRDIAIFLLNNEKRTHQQITDSLDLSPASTTRYLKTLLNANIISSIKNGKSKSYNVTHKQKIAACLITYKESFVDEIVDRFVDAWEDN